MSPPPTVLHLEWHDLKGDQERRYRKPLRCAQQLVSILAAPDVCRLKGLWVTTGWDTNRLEWEPVDVAAFIDEVSDTMQDEDHKVTDWDYALSPRDRYRLVAEAWREHNERSQ